MRAFLLALLLILAAGAARAQAPPPIGTWASNSGGMLVVSGNATCAYVMPSARVQGSCEWMANATGGVLTIHYLTPTATQTFRNPLYFNISWINRGTISIWGEPFYRRN